MKFLIASIMQGPQISGGRYYNAMLANNLRLAGYQADFWSTTKNNMLNEPFYPSVPVKDYDWLIGTPHGPGMWAAENKGKIGAKVAQIVYECPPWLREMAMLYKCSQYLEYANENYWVKFLSALRKSDLIICISNECRKYLEVWMGRMHPPIEVVYPCINNWIADVSPAGKRTDTVVYVGREAYNKKTDMLRRAIEYIRQTKKVPMRYKRIGGYIPEWEKFKAIKEAKVLCIPSIFEGFGIPPAEALYCRTPVVVFDLPVLREAYKDHIIYCSYSYGHDRLVEGLLLATKYKVPITSQKFVADHYTIESQTKRLKEVFG